MKAEVSVAEKKRKKTYVKLGDVVERTAKYDDTGNISRDSLVTYLGGRQVWVEHGQDRLPLLRDKEPRKPGRLAASSICQHQITRISWWVFDCSHLHKPGGSRFKLTETMFIQWDILAGMRYLVEVTEPHRVFELLFSPLGELFSAQ